LATRAIIIEYFVAKGNKKSGGSHYQDVERLWLRWYDAGDWISARLKELGVNPEDI
jgi:hypothetical protein